MEHAYAQALLRMIESGTKPHEVVALMKKNLETRGRLALLPRIARTFARLAAREQAKSTMVLTVAHPKDRKSAIKEAETALTHAAIGDTDLCERVDDTLIGGWRLEGRGLLLDRSWKKSLLSMYNRATH